LRRRARLCPIRNPTGQHSHPALAVAVLAGAVLLSQRREPIPEIRVGTRSRGRSTTTKIKFERTRQRLQRDPEGYKVLSTSRTIPRVDYRGDPPAFRPATRRTFCQVFEIGTATIWREGRDQAGLPADEIGGRSLRRRRTIFPRSRLLHRQQGQHAVAALQQLDPGVLRTRIVSRRPVLDGTAPKTL